MRFGRIQNPLQSGSQRLHPIPKDAGKQDNSVSLKGIDVIRRRLEPGPLMRRDERSDIVDLAPMHPGCIPDRGARCRHGPHSIGRVDCVAREHSRPGCGLILL